MVKNVLNTLRKKQKNNKGFSLVELIVVIAIMAVLVGVLAPQLIRYVEKSRESTDIQNCDNIVTALKAYYADKDNPAETVVVALTTDGVTVKEGKDADAIAKADAIAADKDENPLKDAKLTGTKLRSKKWATEKNATTKNGLTITYTTSTGIVAYEAYADYYVVRTKDTSQIVTKEENEKEEKEANNAG